MSFPVNADVAPIVDGVITSLQSFAQMNEVELIYDGADQELSIYHNPTQIISDLSKVLGKLIGYTPQGERVEVHCKPDNEDVLCIMQNSGVNLGPLGDIRAGIHGQVRVENIVDVGSRFIYVITSEQPTQLHPAGNHDIIRPWYAEVRTTLTQHFQSGHSKNGVELTKRKPIPSIFLQKVHAVIVANFERGGYSAEDLARSMALSKAQLYRKIKALTSMAPGQYISHFRLEKARSLLADPELTVSEVAYQTGHLSLSHFSRAFSREFGCSPSQYRKKSIDETF